MKKNKKDIDIFRDWFPLGAKAWKDLLTARLQEPDELVSQKEKMFALLQLSMIWHSLGDRNASQEALEKCFAYITKYGDEEQRGLAHFMTGHHHLISGRYEEGLQAALKGLRHFQQTALPEFIGRSYRLCANICSQMSLYDEAITYHDRAVDVATMTGDHDFVGECMQRRAETIMNVNFSRSVIDDFLGVISYMHTARPGRDTYAEADSLCIICMIYQHFGEKEKARETWQRCKDMKARIGVDGRWMTVLVMDAGMMAMDGDESGMLAKVQEATTAYDEGRNSVVNYLGALRVCSDFYLKKKDKVNAWKFIEAQQNLINSLAYAESLTGHLNDMLIEYYRMTGDVGQELRCSRELFAYQMRSMQKVSQLRMRHLAITNELELADRQSEVIKKELALKAQELELANRYLQQRNDLLTDLRGSISTLKNENSKREIVFQTLFRKIDAAYGIDENEKGEFRAKLDSTHEAFMSSLSKSWPALSPSECRICALLHAGFNTKEIATLLSTTQRNIETHRLNVRKKMKLKRSDNLQLVLAAVKT